MRPLALFAGSAAIAAASAFITVKTTDSDLSSVFNTTNETTETMPYDMSFEELIVFHGGDVEQAFED